MTTFLGLREQERTAFFIDGANLYKAARNLGFDIDYKNLLAKAKAGCQLLRASYYTAIQEDRDQDYSPLRPLVDWLDYNGYTMVTKVSREFTDQQGRKRFKGSTDVELVVDMMQLANRLDHIVLFFRQWRFPLCHASPSEQRGQGERCFHRQISAAHGV